MRIAIPILGTEFCEHFGRADGFFLCDVDPATRTVIQPRQVVRPKHQCENVPQWLRDMRVTLVIAGGIGPVAQGHLGGLGITVVAGQAGADPQAIAQQYLSGRATKRINTCAPAEHALRHCKRKR